MGLAFAQAGQNPEARRRKVNKVVKVYTDLAQTDVMVFNRRRRFVSGLKREDFELRVDGKLQPQPAQGAFIYSYNLPNLATFGLSLKKKTQDNA